MSFNNSSLSFGIDQILCSDTRRNSGNDNFIQGGYQPKRDKEGALLHSEEVVEEEGKISFQ